MPDQLEIVILGAGGFGREVYEMLWDCYARDEYTFKGFLAQDDSSLRAAGLDESVLGDPETYDPSPSERFILAIGYMDARRKISESLTAKGGQFLSFIHPKAHIASTAKIGEGAVIYPFAIVSNASVLDAHVHLNYYASVGHDCQLGRYCLMAPYATLNGFVTLEHEAYISTHATVAPGRSVGYRSKLSANSAAMQDVPDNTLVFGVPGRQVRRFD